MRNVHIMGRDTHPSYARQRGEGTPQKGLANPSGAVQQEPFVRVLALLHQLLHCCCDGSLRPGRSEDVLPHDWLPVVLNPLEVDITVLKPAAVAVLPRRWYDWRLWLDAPELLDPREVLADLANQRISSLAARLHVL